jgi:hypothetical protein
VTVSFSSAIEELGIRAYVPLHEGDQTSLYYRHPAFSYDAEQNVHHCPQGTVLKFRHRDDANERWLYRANASVCNVCALKSACTSSNQGWLVRRSFHAAYLERVRSYSDMPAYKQAMRKRSGWVEPLFAEVTDWHGLRRFRLRGLVNVNIEALLVATGQNLKRWLAATGWGRRWGPVGCLATPSGQSSLGSPATVFTC